jgi:hypothetical protein
MSRLVASDVGKTDYASHENSGVPQALAQRMLVPGITLDYNSPSQVS